MSDIINWIVSFIKDKIIELLTSVVLVIGIHMIIFRPILAGIISKGTPATVAVILTGLICFGILVFSKLFYSLMKGTCPRRNIGTPEVPKLEDWNVYFMREFQKTISFNIPYLIYYMSLVAFIVQPILKVHPIGRLYGGDLGKLALAVILVGTNTLRFC